MSGDALVAVILAGVVTGGLFSLVGLSVVTTFRSSHILNFASGQFLVLGTYLFYWLAVQRHVEIVLALIVALVLIALVGVVTHFVLMRPVIGQPVFVPVIITLGLSVLLTSVVDILWGSDDKSLPLLVANHTYHFGSASSYLTTYGILTIVMAVVLCLGFLAFERFTRFGLQMRAASENALLANLSGIRVNTIYATGWAIGAMAATLGGLSYAYTNILTPQASVLGFSVLAAVLLAGFENVKHLLIGAMLVGVIESFAIYWFGGDAGDAAAFALLLVFVLIRPSGLGKTAPSFQV